MRLIRWSGLPAFVAALALTASMASPAQADDPDPSAASLGPDFKWGVASSGFQAEGHSPDSNWNRYATSDKAPDPIGNSVDFLNRYKDDIQLAKQMGVKVYRIGVEWARIEPQPGVHSAEGLAYYDDLVKSIVDAGMQPMITIDHWVYPGWEADRGGWKRAGMVNDWVKNAKFVVDRYAKYKPLWITINEPFAYFLREMKIGALTPLDLPAFAARLGKAHRPIYDYIHRRQPGAMVSSNVAFIPFVEPLLDGVFLNKFRNKLDFIGIDYYYPVALLDPSGFNAFSGQFWKASLAPEGIYYVLRHYSRQFPGKPLYVVENGMPTDDGAARADGWTRTDQLNDTVYWLQRAKADGMNLMGYNYWSLTDNYEWGSYEPRFGLYTVDVLTDPTLARKPTDGVAAYRALIAANGVPSGYTPTHAPQTCSLVDFLSSCLDPVKVG